ncbi:hypothetical protein [Schaalia hyovaginalis]|uniref:Uncharacterized protein n=1 Tax=Schaalia hyovaginalis TaxID=29316 RepID=A0A923E2P1_9ACTO|nr:hypothetical protein [Schaalia hyovaginalis]
MTDPKQKTTCVNHAMAAGGPATNAAVAIAALEALRPGPSAGAPSAVTLLTALGEGAIARTLAQDLVNCRVDVRDAADPASSVREPAISSIIEHPGGRMAASTNARVWAGPVVAGRAA